METTRIELFSDFFPPLLLVMAGAILLLIIYAIWGKRRHIAPKEPTPKEKLAPSRYVILNETGNIVIASHRPPSEKLPDDVQKLFLEAISMLCMMTKAVASTTDPQTGRPCSIYNQYALEQMLAHHPLFVHIGQVSTEYEVRKNNDLIKKTSDDMFGVKNNDNVNKKIKAIYTSMELAAKAVSQSGENAHAKFGYLTLYCEDIMGVPVITAVLTHLGREESAKLQVLATKPLWNIKKDVINMRRDSYLYNSPSMQEQFSLDTLTDALKRTQSPSYPPDNEND
ncbi:hypothetical protein A1OO_16380 [Enterovibrio norvegicus FF-33]|uniref:Uncharacterized protein n=1 Tax=Enterovibrio norvegicus FF-454 TaxID=1185651 RepID=A0A1E5BVX4_9GAMM|nr:hypothetical protein [Enterovibrio norvegicus]OEE57404.1 hypothetical protein A1OK_17415 [Enterovibrio norvegicus FF-454]OEE67329.1 hypothetical protein A1OO_16380 [Enterovibrio norvegicus FF-33]OEE73964.1 hypothetical protein A1OQ_10335 [Enterovibrio norvegicus FF-162]